MLLLHEEGGMGRFSRSGAGNTSYRMDVVEEVEEYYCVKGRSFAAISRETGIAASTLKRWSALFGWQESKRRLRKAAVTLDQNRPCTGRSRQGGPRHRCFQY